MPWQETDVLGLMCYPCPRFVPWAKRARGAGFHLPGEPIQNIPGDAFDGFVSAAQTVRPIGGTDGNYRPAAAVRAKHGRPGLAVRGRPVTVECLGNHAQ